jgi:hypothetical protein
MHMGFGKTLDANVSKVWASGKEHYAMAQEGLDILAGSNNDFDIWADHKNGF